MSFFKSKIKKILRKTQNILSNEEEKNTYRLDFKENSKIIFPLRDNKESNSLYSEKEVKNESGPIKIQIFDYRNNSQSFYEINSISDIKKKKEKESQKKYSLNKDLDLYNLSPIEPKIRMEKQLKNNESKQSSTSKFDRGIISSSFELTDNDESKQDNLSKFDREIVHSSSELKNNDESKQDNLSKFDREIVHSSSELKNYDENKQNNLSKTDQDIVSLSSELKNYDEAKQNNLSKFDREIVHSSSELKNKDEAKQNNLSKFDREIVHSSSELKNKDESKQNNLSKIQNQVLNSQPELKSTEKMFLTSSYNKKSNYQIPIEILKYSSNFPKSEAYAKEIEETSTKIENIIKEYGIECNVIHTQKGPIITRYEIDLPRGMKLNKLTSLEGELKVHLAALSVRMAPVIGKSTIGIEIPNSNRENLFLGDIFRKIPSLFAKKNLSVPIGKDITGKEKIIDIAKLPHLLIAGSTGSGKSVCLNSMISSLIYRLSPEEVQFVIIDPKMVELTLYSDIPHLMLPVITNPKFALKALHYIIFEMEKRYQTLSELKCRNLIDYNFKVKEDKNSYINKKYKYFPYIIIFIDELSDLMITAGKELEDLITRITQKARAVGIHLIMATQRPSVDIITGLIKANCPARIAFSVAQKTDSQTILDQTGAETLLGQGDFLYRSPITNNLERIQAPYISESEIEKIVEYAKSFGKPNYQLDFQEENPSYEFSSKDETLIEEAWKVIKTHKKASGSFLQRKLSIGYPTAARIIDSLEERGFIGPENRSKPREILK